MESILLLLAALQPMEKLVSDARDAMNEFLLNPSEDNKQSMLMTSLLVITKVKVESDGGLDNAMKEFMKAKNAYDIGSRINSTDGKS